MSTNHPAQKRYPPELRERAVRMASDAIAAQGGQTYGVVVRVARQLGVGPESLRSWLKLAEIDSGAPARDLHCRRPAHRRSRTGEP